MTKAGRSETLQNTHNFKYKHTLLKYEMQITFFSSSASSLIPALGSLYTIAKKGKMRRELQTLQL